MKWFGLLATWVALMGLVATTLWLAYVPLGRLNTPIALGISLLKVALIALVFMELIRARGFVRLAATAGLIWIAVMFTLTFSDFAAR